MPNASPPPPTRVGRASALPPDERRAAITEATVELLVTCGHVTTRQIAEAAGVAEGTIFRVFPDKEAVLQAAVDAVADPAALEAELSAIDPDLPVEAQLAAAVRAIAARVDRIWRVLTNAGPAASPFRRPPELPAMTALFEPIRGALRVSPATAARQLRSLTVAMAHPALGEGETLTPEEVVSLLLDGIRERGGPR